jgi:hypothetical protein
MAFPGDAQIGVSAIPSMRSRKDPLGILTEATDQSISEEGLAGLGRVVL